MDAWIKILVVMVMMSVLSLVIGLIISEPFLGLILLAFVLTLLVLTLEPATGKAMAQVTIPIILILFAFEVILDVATIFEPWTLLVIGAVLYLLFALFTGGGSMESAFLDAKVSLKLFPIYGLAIFISMWSDPTGRTSVLIMTGTIGTMMIMYMVALRNYDNWPKYQYKLGEVRAISDINPRGKVKTGAEIWRARTVGPPIKEGEKVLVIEITGLTMLVAKDDGSYIPSGMSTDQ